MVRKPFIHASNSGRCVMLHTVRRSCLVCPCARATTQGRRLPTWRSKNTRFSRWALSPTTSDVAAGVWAAWSLQCSQIFQTPGEAQGFAVCWKRTEKVRNTRQEDPIDPTSKHRGNRHRHIGGGKWKVTAKAKADVTDSLRPCRCLIRSIAVPQT